MAWDDDYNVNELGLLVGHVAAISGQRRHKKRHPLGFAATPGQPDPQPWPDVPKFDIALPAQKKSSKPQGAA